MYVYATSDDGRTWSEVQKLVASNGGVDDYFGISVAIFGNTILAGAWYDDAVKGSNTGVQSVFIDSINVACFLCGSSL